MSAQPRLSLFFLRSAICCLTGAALCCGASLETVAYVRLDHPPKRADWQPGTVLNGRLSGGLYNGSREIVPSGSHIRLSVAKIEKRRRAGGPDSQPFPIHLFSSKYENVPSFETAIIARPGASELAAGASLIRSARVKNVRAKGTGPSDADRGGWLMVLKLEISDIPPEGVASTAAVNVPSGTRARLMLLQPLSASKSRRGQTFLARVVEPVRESSGVVLPAGTLFEGVVTKRIPPRRLSRPGSLALSFTKLKFPGAEAAVTASPVSVEPEGASRLHMDTEGGLHAGGPGIARVLLDAGISLGLSKVADDTAQLLIEAVVATATDASTAGVARIVAAGVSGVFLLTRHGRDVILPEYTRMEVVLNRPASLPVASQ